jgi:hypothetical protein
MKLATTAFSHMGRRDFFMIAASASIWPAFAGAEHDPRPYSQTGLEIVE